MRCTSERALELMQQWREKDCWVFAVARFSEGDEHRFWARIRIAAQSEIWLAGECAMVSLRLDSKDCHYSELASLPPDFADHLKDFGECLTIRCDEFSAVLAALKPDAHKS